MLTIVLLTCVLPGVATGAEPPENNERPSAAIETPVTATHQTMGPANNSPALAADPNDARFVVMANRLDAPDFSCALHLSGDGGRGWVPAIPVPDLPEGAEKCYAPEVAFDRRGVLYYLFVGLAGPGNEPMGVFLTSSSDRGRTFSPPHQLLGPHNFAVRMAVDQQHATVGRIHLVWIKATSDPPLGGFGPPPNPILAAHSDDGGKTFSEPVQISDPNRERVVAPALALGSDGSVHVAYYDLGGDALDYQGLEGPVWEGHWSVVLATSTDKGRTFDRGVVIDDDVVPPERVMLVFTMSPPALAVHEHRICIGWPDARKGDPDILARCSTDDPRAWAPAVRINDDRIGNGISQLLPRLDFAPSGRIDALFYDRRVESGNFANDAYFSYSTDGGHTWAANLRLSRYGSDSRIGQEYVHGSAQGLVEFGTRLGLLSRERSTLAAWSDTRNSLPETTTQDIFTTVVTLPDPRATDGLSPLPMIAAVAGGGVILGVFVWCMRRRGRRNTAPVGAAEGR